MPIPNSELPVSLAMSDTDFTVLECLSAEHGETPTQYIEATIGLIALWGEIIEIENCAPGIMQGIVEPNRLGVKLLELPELLDDCVSAFEERDQVAEEFGLQPGDIDETMHVFFLPTEDQRNLGIAVAYFGISLPRLTGIYVNIRDDVLKAGDEDRPYVYTADEGETWKEIIVERNRD